MESIGLFKTFLFDVFMPLNIKAILLRMENEKLIVWVFF